MEHVAAGFDPAAWGGLTPRVAYLQMRGAGLRAERARDQAMTVAWMGVALARSKKLPPLDRIVGRTRAGRRRSPEPRQSTVELQANLDILAVRWGARKPEGGV